MMKHLNLSKLYVRLSFVITLTSCSSEIGSWKNEQISQSKRDELHALNNEVFKHLKANDTKKLESYLSKELLESNYTSRIAERIGNRLRADSFAVFDEYYVMNKYIAADTISNLKAGINSYQLIYPGSAQEMYFCLLTPKSNAVLNKYMVTIVYSHYNYGWKLSKLDIGTYTINGKTAPELYEIAKKQYSDNYLLAAANTMTLATSCTRPTDAWIYKNEEDLYKFSGKVLNEANSKYNHPIPLKNVSTQPLIIRVFNDTSNEGTYPTIIYLTKINIKNVEAIKKENAEVRKVIGTVIPGINKGRLFYSVYNQLPSSTRSVPHYDIKGDL